MGIWAIACICWVSFCGGLLSGGGGLFLGMRGMEVFEREIERQTEKRHKKNSIHLPDERKDDSK